MRIRRAEEHDLAWIDGQLDRLQAETMRDLKHSLIPKRENVRRVLLESLMDKHVLLVAQLGMELVGFVAVSVGPHVLNPDLITANEHLWWVIPEMRTTSAGARLLDAALQECRELGAQTIWWSAQLDNGSPGARSLVRRGFREKERQWLKELDSEESGV
jgi:N-acetylglutamate synthase-like GNAT family acetyltransferase